MKKISVFMAIAIIFISVAGSVPAFAAQTYTPPFEVRAQSVYMKNLDTNQVMMSVNEDLRLPPASLVKMMTAILTIENVKDVDNESATLKMYLNDMIYGTGSSTGGFWPGDTASIRDVLYSLLLQSAGECALMLADYVGDGSINRFVEMMNDRAKELGCTNTNFTNPHGLHDDNQYSTAKDMAIIAEHAMSLPLFREIVGTYTYPVKLLNRDATLTQYSTNSMLKTTSEYYYGPIMGIKTGTLPEVGRCLATQAKLNGYTYLLVLMGVPQYEADGSLTQPTMLSFSEAKKLFQWVFDSFSVRTAIERGEELVEIPVKYSFDGDFVRLATAEQYTALLHKEIDVKSIQYLPEIPEYLTAPVEKGQEVGKLSLIFAGEKIGEVPLVATSSLALSKPLAFLGWFQNEIHSFHMKFAIVFVVLIVTLYTMLIVRSHNLRKRKGRYSSYRTGGDRKYHI